MRILRAVSTFAPLVIVLACAATGRDDRQRQVDAVFADFREGLTPGVAVAVVRDGKTILSKGYGYADLEHRIPITGTSVFDVASVSKQFTGLAIAMLVEQGRIALTDDIRKHIPEFPDFGRTITIGHLVHHTSGLRDWPATLALAGWRMDDVITFDQILTLAYTQRTLNFDPGSEYTYSNTGYNILAELVRRVTGKSFRAWTDENLFAPLGMTRSHFRDDHTEVFPDRVLGYSRAEDGSFRATPNNLMALGSSSLLSTAEDLAKWLANFDEARVGGPKAMALMRTVTPLNNGSPNNYAFGISIGKYRDQPTLAHSGGWAAFSTFVVHFPEQKTGIVVLANHPFDASAAAYKIADVYLDSLLGPRSPPAERKAATVSATVFDRYVGLYKLDPGWYVRIKRRGDTLLTQASREAAFPMMALSDSTFWIDAYNAEMRFRPTAASGMEMFYRGRPRPRIAESTRPSDLSQYVGTYVSDELEATYHVELQKESLVIRHWRHGTFPLTWLWGDDFTASPFYLRSVEFRRDASGRVTGLSVHAGERSRDNRFARRE